MDCEICMEPFDAACRRPKVLPCGHSACLACLHGLPERRCPECRREFTSAAEDLPDNFYLLKSMDTTRSQPRRRLWCCDCKAIATPDCLDSHTLRSTKTALKDKVERLQVQAAQIAENLPEALRVDDDDAREQVLRVLELARQPGTTLEVSVRGQSGEALTATWTSPPSTPAGQQDAAAEAVEAVTTKVLVLALAKKGLWQQRGEQGRGEAAGQDGAQDQGGAQGGAAPDLPVLEELKMGKDPTPERKDELLRTARGHRVRRLTSVWCDKDPAWSLQLLQLALPHVEELEVYFVQREHLEAVLAMPRLRRLHVLGHSWDPSAFPAELPPLPAHHVGLRWLSVENLPRETFFSLIRRHAGTLEELWLWVGARVAGDCPLGIPGGGEWPAGCKDLHAALGRCGLARLRRLLLGRHSLVHFDDTACHDQLSRVRGALPGVRVHCTMCEDVICNKF